MAKKKAIREENLTLFKTGRTNANDGGIDFVMRPLGRFFQVTETVDVSKYFLDIDKIQRFPLTFVVKSNDSVSEIEQAIKTQAKVRYKIEAVVAGYMQAIEEIINIPRLLDCLKTVITTNGNQAGHGRDRHPEQSGIQLPQRCGQRMKLGLMWNFLFMSLVAERPPKVAVGFNPRSAIPPNHLVAERRSNHRHTISDQFHSRRCPPPSIVAPRRIIPVSSPSVG